MLELSPRCLNLIISIRNSKLNAKIRINSKNINQFFCLFFNPNLYSKIVLSIEVKLSFKVINKLRRIYLLSSKATAVYFSCHTFLKK